MKRLLFALSLIIVTTAASAETIAFLKPYEQLLQKYVHPGTINGVNTHLINYKAWQKDPLHNKAMNLLQKDQSSKYKTKEMKMSFWINAYNLLVVDLIITEAPQKSIQDLGGLVGDPWNAFTWVVDGVEYNLDYLRNQVIRPFHEMRANFALTCGAISCPPLKRTPYWPDKIYSQLDKQTQTFVFNKKLGMRIEKSIQGKSESIRAQDHAYISDIFAWYTDELPHNKPKRFISRYMPLEHISIDGYLPFNWNLNALKKNYPVKNGKLNAPKASRYLTPSDRTNHAFVPRVGYHSG